MNEEGFIEGYLLLPVVEAGGYRGVDRHPFVPQFDFELGSAPASSISQRSAIWEYAPPGWRRDAYKLYEENSIVEDSLELIADEFTAVRIRDMIQTKPHEITFCRVAPLQELAKTPKAPSGGVFLGYDLAYSGGDFYSAVRNGLIVNPSPSLMRQFLDKLNQNMLFDTKEFLLSLDEKFRQAAVSEANSEFFVYELWLCA